MHIVAIYNIGEDKQSLAARLAGVLKVTNFEALSRLRTPGRGPLVVGLFAEPEQAARLAEQLGSEGFNAVVLSDEEIANEAGRWKVRRFSFREEGLFVESRDGKERTLGYDTIDLIVRGMGITTSSSTETTKQRKFDLGSAMLSGGLKMTKTTKTTREVAHEQREGFLHVYGSGPLLVFSENNLDYEALGPALGLSRTANFQQFTTELRSRCSRALYDDRLLTRAGTAGLLGPALSPEEHLVVATALLAKVLRGNL